MKKTCYFLAAILAFLCMPLFANQSLDVKLYLDSATIKVLPEGLFLELDEGLLPIETVSKDEQGIFIVSRSEQLILYCVSCGLQFDMERQSPYCPHPAK